MAVSVAQVEALNEKIEKLNTSRTATETKKEILTQNLTKKLAEYAEKYGIDLNGSKFSETFKNIQAEAQKVSAEVETEYNLKQSVVSAIESGDIAEANKLLGISEDEDSEEVEVLEEIGEPITSEDFVAEGMSPMSEAVEELPEEPEEEEDEGGSVLGEGINLGLNSDMFADEDEDEDEDDEFSMDSFMGGKLE